MEPESSWASNAKVIADSPAIEYKHIGILTSIVGVYMTNRNSSKIQSGVHVGRVGERIRRRARLRSATIAKFGYRYMFVDRDHNEFVCFMKSDHLMRHEGEIYDIDGTIKNHSQWGTRLQNDLTKVVITEG
ncbi:hypothetical protein D3C71_1839880 [compost metagenome]